MAVGDALFMRLAIREGMAKALGLAPPRTAQAPPVHMSWGPQEGVVASSGDDVVWRGDGAGGTAGAPADVLMFPGRTGEKVRLVRARSIPIRFANG